MRVIGNCIDTRPRRPEIDRFWNLGSLLPLAFTFADDGLVESISDGVWEGINFVVSVNFDCFTRCVADNEAVVAPLKMLFQLRFKLDVDTPVQVFVKFLKEVFAFHCGLAPSLLAFWK